MTSKATLAIRNWIAGVALVLIFVTTVGAAYVKVNERVTRNEASFAELKGAMLRVLEAVEKMQDKVGGLEVKVGQLQTKVSSLETKVDKLDEKMDTLVHQFDGF